MTRDELIAALEAATGPSRELDCYIEAVILGGEVRVVGPPTYDPQRYFFNPNPQINWIGYDLLNNAPFYTASVDAALSLVPEGWSVHLHSIPWRGLVVADISDGDHRAPSSVAETLPLALCIASLKAR